MLSSSFVSHSVVCHHREQPQGARSEPATMPGVQDWRTTPCAIIDDIFQRQPDGEWEQQVDAFFAEHLSDAAIDQLPSLNDTPTRELSHGQVIRFRCMIQDMFDPEFYLSVFELRNLATGEVQLRNGKFRELTPCGRRDEICFDSNKTVNKTRQTFYCVNIPGESQWVVEGYKQRVPAMHSFEPPNGLKRSVEDKLDDHDTACEDMDTSGVAPVQENCKRARLETPENGSAPRQSNGSPSTVGSVDLNLPIPDSKNGKACLVKIYDDSPGYSVNHCYEFIGIILLDPCLTTLPVEPDEGVFSSVKEQAVRSPPPLVVPKLHVLKCKKLVHCNPKLPQELPTLASNDAARTRQELHAILTKMLLGDTLSADYLICHILSKVYLRKDFLALGKLTINLFNVPLHEKFVKRVATVLQLLLTKQHYLPLTVDNLNNIRFVPKKDYDANRLMSGLLQLSENTHLILDETTMEPGQLNEEGLKNLTSLGSLIKWQRLEYNFSYSNVEFPCDVPSLILSEGRSILPSDVEIMLRPSEVPGPTVIRGMFSAISSYLTLPLLERVRNYITIVGSMPFNVSDEVQSAIQEDYAHDRQDILTPYHPNAEDLHRRLVLSRLMALSYGQKELTMNLWQKVKAMDYERRDRAAHLPERSRQEGMYNLLEPDEQDD